MNKFSTTIFTMALLASGVYGQQRTIAVLPVDCAGFSEPQISEVVTNITQGIFVQYSNDLIVERSQVTQILSEQKFQMSGLTNQALEVGALLSADAIVIGSLGKLGKTLNFSLRLVDVSSGEVIKSEQKKGKISIDDLSDLLIDPVVARLISNTPSRTFTIRNLSVVGLPNMDSFSMSDCWVQVYIGNKNIGRTQFITDSNSPSFSEEFEVKNYMDEMITFILYEHDLSTEIYIGTVGLYEPTGGKHPVFKVVGNNSYPTQIQLEFIIDR